MLIFHSELAHSIRNHDIWSDWYDSPWFSRYLDFCPRSWIRSSFVGVLFVRTWHFRDYRATSDDCNFRTSGRNFTKPPPNENINSKLSFGGGFTWFRPLARKLQPPEVARLGGRHGGRPQVCSAATPQKYAPSLSSHNKNSPSFQAMNMIFISNESFKSILSNGESFT